MTVWVFMMSRCDSSHWENLCFSLTSRTTLTNLSTKDYASIPLLQFYRAKFIERGHPLSAVRRRIPCKTAKSSAALIEKLGHLTSRHNAALLNHPVYMDGTAKPDNEAVYYAIDAIQTAIHEQRAISFRYFEYTPKKEKVLKHKGYRYGFSPYSLIWNRDFYYAVGWSEKHGKLAQFRVDRMTAIRESDAPYTADPSFDPASYIREVFGMYHDAPKRVTLLCENRTMRSVIDHFGEDVATEVVDAKHFRAAVDVAPTPPFFSWVFTFGGAIRIESPADVLARMKEMAAWLCI